MTGCRVNYFQVQKEGGRVITLEKMGTEKEAHLVIRRTYVCKLCPTFHRTVVSIEYGKEIEKWFPIVHVSYRFDGSPKSFLGQINRETKKRCHPWDIYAPKKA